MIQIVLQDLQRLNIEIIRRLIQYKNVRRTHKHTKQVQPTLLSSGQLCHLRILFALHEQESLTHGRCCDQPVTRADILPHAPDNINHCVRARQVLIFLAEISCHDRLSPLHGPFIRLEHPRQYFDQRRLSASVRSDDPDPVILQKIIGKIVEQALPAIAFAQHPRFDRLIAHSRRNRLDDHIPFLDDLLPVPQRFEPLNMRLLLSRPRPCAPHHPRQILLVERSHLPLCGKGVIHPLLLCLQVLFIVSGITVDPGPVDLPDRCCHLIQKIPVVRDHHQCAPVARQLILKPLDHLVVQMVGRLIQNENIARRKQSRRQRSSFPLTAGKCSRH